jgi:Ca-activated chloride channel family protein
MRLGFFGIALLVIALARPQWGSRWEVVHRRGLDILIALDVSKSMLAEDVKPNRLERAKLALRDFAEKHAGDRLGLIVFAGDAYLSCPLTSDMTGFLRMLEDTTVRSAPRGGTNLTAAIEEAARSIRNASGPEHILILLSDGEDHEGDPLEIAEKAHRNLGLEIFTIGIGTQEGDLIPVSTSEGQNSFLKNDEGNVVKTRLEEGLLEKLALRTQGAYFRATATDLGLDYFQDQHFARREPMTKTDSKRRIAQERFQIFLLGALLALSFELALVERGA